MRATRSSDAGILMIGWVAQWVGRYLGRSRPARGDLPACARACGAPPSNPAMKSRKVGVGVRVRADCVEDRRHAGATPNRTRRRPRCRDVGKARTDAAFWPLAPRHDDTEGRRNHARAGGRARRSASLLGSGWETAGGTAERLRGVRRGPRGASTVRTAQVLLGCACVRACVRGGDGRGLAQGRGKHLGRADRFKLRCRRWAE